MPGQARDLHNSSSARLATAARRRTGGADQVHPPTDIVEFAAVEAGELPHNHEVMREAKALAARLPVLEADRFRPEFYTQCNDAALLTYLGVVMKSCNNMNQFINKFGVLHQRPGGSRRMRGLFF